MSGSGAEIYRLADPLGDRAGETLAALASMPGVLSVEPDLWVTADGLPGDPYAGELWGLAGPSDGSAYGIDATGVWPATEGTGVTVAVIDTGLVSHPDLAGQSVPGYDLVADASISHDGDGRDSDASDPGDWCGTGNSSWHGTHVAGTIAAIANNGIGVFGGAPAVKIEPVRVIGACGGYSSDLADGIRWAAGGTVAGLPANPHPARILNLSLGSFSETCPAELASAIANATARGAMVIASAGNSAMTAARQTPANCPGVFTVAAIDSAGLKSIFSNYGARVDIAAPGVNILSTVDSGLTVPAGPAYSNYSGTSMATPHVVVAAALLASAFPTLTSAEIEFVLQSTTTPVAADANPEGCLARGCGAGVVSAGRALGRLAEPIPLVGRVAASIGFPLPSSPFLVTAAVIDAAGVAAADWSIDGGGWSPMNAVDGAFGELGEPVSATVTAPASEGQHTICVRATDTNANASDAAACTTVTVDAGPPTVTGPVINPPIAVSGSPVAVTATTTDGNAVASAQVSIDGRAWVGLTPTDGVYGAKAEALTGVVNDPVVGVAGGYHSCAILSGGTVQCWGVNSFGELGDGTTTHRSTPAPVPGLAGVTAVAVGLNHTCALLGDATVRCWGFNGWGALGDGTWSNRSQPVPVVGLSGVTAIAAGANGTCAILADKTVRCWGTGLGLGDGVGTPSSTPVAVAGLSGVTAIMGGAGFFGGGCALLSDTTVRCWGEGSSGWNGDGTTQDRLSPVPVAGLSGVVAIAGPHPCALLGDGTVRCWGGNWAGQLGDGTTTTRLTPVAVAGLTGVAALGTGGDHTCALLRSGTVSCWGYNADGEVGDGTTVTRLSPVPVAGLSGVTALSAGVSNTCALLGDRTVRCWGINSIGELGDGTSSVRLTPVPVEGIGALGGGTHRVCVRATDSASNTSSGAACASLVISDTRAPTATAPSVTLRPAARLAGTAVPLTLRWSGSDNTGGSGIARYELARSTSGGAWVAVSMSLATPSASVTAATSGTVRYRVRAIDKAGNVGAWSYGLTLAPRLTQQTSAAVTWRGPWYRTSSTSYSGGSAKYSKVAGSSVAYTFTGRSIALVTTVARTRGKVKVYVNGIYQATVDLYRSSTQYRVLAWQKTWSTSASRTIKLVVVGTSGRHRVDLDGFVVVR